MSTRTHVQEIGIKSVNEDALRDVLGIERTVQVIIQNAEVEASRIIETASVQAAAMQADEYAFWQETNEADREEFRRELNAQAQEIRVNAQQAIERWVAGAQAKVPQALDYVRRIVVLSKADG